MKKRKMWFFAPDEGGGSGEGETSKGVAAVAPEADEGASGEAGRQQDDDKPPVAATVDVDALTKGLATQFGDILTEKFKAPTVVEKTVDQLTPEEAEKILNVWKPTKEWIQRFDNLETREVALGELRDGVVKHTDTITQFRIREATKELTENVGQMKKFIDEYQNEKANERFHKKYDQLADPALAPLVSAITDDLHKNKKKFETEDALFEAIATGVEKVIQVSNKDFKLTPGSSPGNKTNQSAGGIPVTSPGAGGGTGARGKVETPVKRGIAVFQP